MKINFTHPLVLLLALFSLTSINSYSQLNQWTWVKGANTINSYGQAGIPNIPSAANNPSARREQASWKDNEGSFWIFGGHIGHDFTTLGDLWKYNPSTNEWTLIVTEGTNRPTPRFGSTSWTDQAGNLWLFGGLGFTNLGLAYMNDLWKYNIYTNLWTLVNGSVLADQHGIYGDLGVAANGVFPGARMDASCWVDATGSLWLFGGVGYAASNTIQGSLNDLWKYNTSNNMWTWVKGDSVIDATNVYGIIHIPSPLNKPGGYRTGAVTWRDGSNNLWMFGGTANNDLWKYNISTNEWAWVNGSMLLGQNPIYGTQGIPDPISKPGSSNNCFGWTDTNGDLWMFGGRGIQNSIVGEMNLFWRYNIPGDVWTFISGDPAGYPPGIYGTMGIAGANNSPGGREAGSGWTDDAGNLWLFGGGGYPPSSGASFDFNDVWKYTLNIIVPVKLLSFTGQLKPGNVLLNWAVENERTFDHYEIERSIDGIQFEKRGQVKGINLKNYNSTDNVSGFEGKIVYYRLKMVDIDGRFNYSNIINFRIPINTIFIFYPNPAYEYTQLKFSEELHGKIHIEMADATGRIVLKNNYELLNGAIFFSTTKFLGGTYSVTAIYEGERYVQHLVIMR